MLNTIQAVSKRRRSYDSAGLPDCWAFEARELNVRLVEGRDVQLSYDGACEDAYGRLLAYVDVGGRNVNALLVERGYACALFIPPGGSARVDEFLALEARARERALGMWGACSTVTCL